MGLTVCCGDLESHVLKLQTGPVRLWTKIQAVGSTYLSVSVQVEVPGLSLQELVPPGRRPSTFCTNHGDSCPAVSLEYGLHQEGGDAGEHRGCEDGPLADHIDQRAAVYRTACRGVLVKRIRHGQFGRFRGSWWCACTGQETREDVRVLLYLVSYLRQRPDGHSAPTRDRGGPSSRVERQMLVYRIRSAESCENVCVA